MPMTYYIKPQDNFDMQALASHQILCKEKFMQNIFISTSNLHPLIQMNLWETGAKITKHCGNKIRYM